MEWIITKPEENTYLYTHPAKAEVNNFYKHGFFVHNRASYDLREFQLIELTLELTEDIILEVDFCLFIDNSPLLEKQRHGRQCLAIKGCGKKQVSLILNQFDDSDFLSYDYKFVREIKIHAEKPFILHGISFKKGDSINMSSEILSKSGNPGDTIFYPVKLLNCEEQEKKITLFQKKEGWEILSTDLEKEITLGAGEEKTILVKVEMNERIVPGGYEKQRIIAIPDGDGRKAEELTFLTSRYLNHPHMLVNEEELQAVKDKIKKGGWAKETAKIWEKKAYDWQVPVMEEDKYYLFMSGNADNARCCAIMYQLTGKKEYAKKVAKMLLQLADPKNGYLRLPHASNQELVHEGGFFKHIALAYDFIYDTEFLTIEDHKHIENTFRYLIELMDESLFRGEISNWSLMEAQGALYCAAVLQDRERMNRFLFEPGGITDHISKGILSDGFWYECSIGYNFLCAGLLSEAAQIVKHFGIDLANLSVPASYSKRISYPKFIRDGLINEAWGPNTKSYRNITMLWDSLLPFFDYRLVIPGINDSCETKIAGISVPGGDPRYDLAYYLYKKPEYANIVRNMAPHERDLLFGMDELEDTQMEDNKLKSVYADNGGLAILRSAKKGRTPAEQIQIALKYGCHGGAHGHYDRVSITGISRYGKSLYSPEHTWFSYHTFVYKFYVQNSINHNMVTVDLKQQDPAEPKRTLFYSSEKLQACELSNYSRWSNPPYGGWSVDVPDFRERTWLEGKYVPIPEKTPEYMERTDFTEEVYQKRLTLVTDDYIVNFDYIRGEQEHQYDCIYHLKGLKSIEGEEILYTHHTEQLETNPLGSAQFITDCDWYRAKEKIKLQFETFYDEEHNNGGKWLSSNRTAHNEFGQIKYDLYALLPEDFEMVTGHTLEYDHMYKQLWYEAALDGEVKAAGNFGAWVLGKDRIHLDVTGAKTLTLTTKVQDVEFEPDIMQYSKDNIFWGDGVLTLKDGSKVYLKDLQTEYKNIKLPEKEGFDYEGGSVKIQGKQYDFSLPGEPEQRSEEGVITLLLDGVDAVSFDICIGADYPIGEEEDIRKSILFRKTEKEARFLTLLELYEEASVIEEIHQKGHNKLQVKLKDGRTQSIQIENFEEESIPTVITLEEFFEGKLVGKEVVKEAKSY